VRAIFRLRNVNIVGFYYLFNCYMFQSYDDLQAEVYLLELTLLITDPLFFRILVNMMNNYDRNM
jgi:hypothetical protein